MQLVDEKEEASVKAPIYPGSAVLRRAVRQNIVSFPSQIQAFLRRPAADMQCRVVLLFFVRGWTSIQIAARFGVPKHVIRGILNEWSVRALALGYIQVIDPKEFATCCRVDDEYSVNRETGRFVGVRVQEEVQVYAVA
jgi:hypothetical protein